MMLLGFPFRNSLHIPRCQKNLSCVRLFVDNGYCQELIIMHKVHYSTVCICKKFSLLTLTSNALILHYMWMSYS